MSEATDRLRGALEEIGGFLAKHPYLKEVGELGLLVTETTGPHLLREACREASALKARFNSNERAALKALADKLEEVK